MAAQSANAQSVDYRELVSCRLVCGRGRESDEMSKIVEMPGKTEKVLSVDATAELEAEISRLRNAISNALFTLNSIPAYSVSPSIQRARDRLAEAL